MTAFSLPQSRVHFGALAPRRVRQRSWEMAFVAAALSAGLAWLALPALAQALMHPIEARFERASLLKQQRIVGFIALGGGDDRIREAARLARAYSDAKLVITGHGARADELARESGLAPDRLIIEPAATTTFENALFTSRLLPARSDGRWVLVTSDYHMPRAVGAFRKAGLDVIAWPTPSLFGSWDAKLIKATHEWIGLLSYWMLGRSSALFPAEADARFDPRLAAGAHQGARS